MIHLTKGVHKTMNEQNKSLFEKIIIENKTDYKEDDNAKKNEEIMEFVKKVFQIFDTCVNNKSYSTNEEQKKCLIQILQLSNEELFPSSVFISAINKKLKELDSDLIIIPKDNNELSFSECLMRISGIFGLKEHRD